MGLGGGLRDSWGWVLTNCAPQQAPRPSSTGAESPEGRQAECHCPCSTPRSTSWGTTGFLGGFAPQEGRREQRLENVGDFAVVLDSEGWGRTRKPG